MSEEPGLGGRAYGKEHAADIANHFAGIETDSGAGHPMGIYVTGDESLTKVLQPVADVLQTSGREFFAPRTSRAQTSFR